MTPAEEADHYFEEQFPLQLLKYVNAKSCFGGAIFFERMNFVERFVIKKVAKIKHNVNQVSDETIDRFISTFQNA